MGDRQDMIVLKIEGAIALYAATAITLKDSASQLRWDGNARRATVFLGPHEASG
jgi:hypothetical protein